MSDDDIRFDRPIRMGTFKFKSVDPEWSRQIIKFASLDEQQIPMTLTITTHHFRVRRRLAYLRPLMRRTRGRKLLGVQTWVMKLELYNMTSDRMKIER